MLQVKNLEELDRLINDSDKRIQVSISDEDCDLNWALESADFAKAYIIAMRYEILELKKQVKELQDCIRGTYFDKNIEEEDI